MLLRFLKTEGDDAKVRKEGQNSGIDNLSPRYIRPKPASDVKLSAEFIDFLDWCKDEWLRGKAQTAFSELKADRELGEKVTKDRFPKYYRKTWNPDNLYVHKLGPDWRMTYTIVYDGAGLSVFCLEILTHKEYDKRFGYKTT